MWHLVSDTSSDLYTVEGGEGVFDFATIPFSIRIGGKEYMDDENINIDEMLTANENHAEQAQTSCPSPEEFGEKFRAPGPVIAFTISSALSGTYNSACIARDMILEEEPDKQIAVIDSKATGPEEAMLILKARDLILAGTPFAEIESALNQAAAALSPATSASGASASAPMKVKSSSAAKPGAKSPWSASWWMRLPALVWPARKSSSATA